MSLFARHNPAAHNLSTPDAIVDEHAVAAGEDRARAMRDALDPIPSKDLPPDPRARLINLARLGFTAGAHRVGHTWHVYLPAAAALGLTPGGLPVVVGVGHITIEDWCTYGEHICYLLLDAAAKAACAAAEAAKGVR